jgi:hypothetical protein
LFPALERLNGTGNNRHLSNNQNTLIKVLLARMKCLWLKYLWGRTKSEALPEVRGVRRAGEYFSKKQAAT